MNFLDSSSVAGDKAVKPHIYEGKLFTLSSTASASVFSFLQRAAMLALQALY